MPVSTLNKRRSERRLSFQRSSDPDVSECYHRNTNASTYRERSFLRRLSVSSKWPRRLSIMSDKSDGIMEIDPTTQALAISEADQKRASFRESLPKSLVQAHEARDCLAPFRKEEIVLGPKLGAGKFSNVYEVQSFQLQPHLAEDATLSVEELDQRLHMKQNETCRESKNARYALKHIKEEYYHQHGSESYVQAASDLALEAEILASLKHPNIIKLRGITHSGAAGFANGPSGYFLVIDCLVETLDHMVRTGRFANRRDQRRSIFRCSSTEDLSQPVVDTNETMDERLSVAFRISAAMVYLHKHSIIFRDLKPVNIGFDVRGDVKIFDFGLARIMPENGDNNHDVFAMSGAGSPRYMAPECLNGSPYNLKADVYSFAIVLWEILSGKHPHTFVRSRDQLIHYVVEQNGRPVIEESWPSPIQRMLESSFDSDIEKRPKMTLWYGVIRKTLASLRRGDMRGLTDSKVLRRRSSQS